MKIAFHFNADYPKFDGFYGIPIEEVCFCALLKANLSSVNMKIFRGDLLIHNYAKTQEQLEAVRKALLTPERSVWSALSPKLGDYLLKHNIDVVLFEGMPRRLRDHLHRSLCREEVYLGAMQIHEAVPIHWVLYKSSLIPVYRIVGSTLRKFYYEGGDRDEGLVKHWRTLPFKKVEFEDLGFKYTVFDKYHSFEHAKRVANLTEDLGDILGFVAESVITRVADIAPKIPDMLYSALSRFETAATEEDYAQLAATCRRVLKKLADALYPPRSEKVNGRSVTEDKYINRLRAYLKQRRTETDSQVVFSELEDIGNRITRLHDLASKGVHAEIDPLEARRVLLRTVMLLDDFLTVTPQPQRVEAEMDWEALYKAIGLKRD